MRLVRSVVSGILYFAVILDEGKGENVDLPPTRNRNAAVMRPSGKLHLESHQSKSTETPVNAVLKQQAPKTAQHFFLSHDDTVNAKKSEDAGSKHEATSIGITRPLNDTVFFVGDVVVSFDTRGFTPSAESPIEVLVPQNGEKPALLESGNVFTLVMDTPYTQLVTVSAVVRGWRVSSSVVFSTVLSQAAILSMRAPLPVDAVWGISSDPASRLHQPRRDPKMSITEAGSSRFDRSTRGQRLERGAGAQHQNGEGGVDEPPSPLSLVYVGSLSLDGQKHIWLQQMEGLPRHRFAPTFLTFQDAGGEEGARVDDGEAATWKRQAADNFERRVRRAGVPLMKVASPRLVASDFDDLVHGGTLTNDSAVAAPVTPLKEAVFKLLLDSVDRAGGEPHLMSPPWAREVFSRIAEGVKNASPDVLVVASGRTLGDVVLTRAARWAMGNRGRIVVDFPNMEPVPGISADVLATPSHFVARHPDIQALAAAAGARVAVIPPGVDVTPSPPRQPEDNHQAAASEKPAERTLCHPWCMSDALENSNHCDPLCFVVGFVGRLAPEKGPGLFLAVAEGIAQLIPSAHFVVVGDGPLRPDLEAMASRLGLDRRVHFVGWAEGEKLQRHLAEMSLLFNPSLVPETFCVSNIEAMAAGTPVAAFGVGGMLEYLSPGANSFVLDDADPRAAAAAIASVLLDRPRLERAAAAGKRDVLTSFRADTALGRWAELYEALGRGEGGSTTRVA